MTMRAEDRAAQIWDDDGGSIPPKSEESPGSGPPGSFAAKTFQIPELKGTSARNIRELLKLYADYVKVSNQILNSIRELPKDDAHSNELSLLRWPKAG